MIALSTKTKDLHSISSNILSATSRLASIQKCQKLQPIRYTARLSWEALYNVKEAVSIISSSYISESQKLFKIPEDELRSDLHLLLQVIERTMSNLRKIENEDDLDLMKDIAQGCCRDIQDCLVLFPKI